MAQVEVTVNGRAYQVACDDGEEEHLLSLADYIDRKVSDLAAAVGQIGDARLMLMAGLVIADELAATVDRLEAAQTSSATVAGERDSLSGNAVASLRSAVRRIEDIAARLERA